MSGHVLFLFLFFSVTGGSRILGVFPHFGKSHFYVFQPLMEELAKKGHQVTVLSCFPRSNPMENYEDVELPSVQDTIGFIQSNYLEKNRQTINVKMNRLLNAVNMKEEISFSHKNVMELSKRKFDLIIMETFVSDLYFSLAYKIGAPVILFSTHALSPWVADDIGLDLNPSFTPVFLSNFSDRMNFYERAQNLFEYFYMKFCYKMFFQKNTQSVAQKYFKGIPDLTEISKNTSMIFVNSHFSMFRSRSFLPSVVEVGGIHMKPVKALNEDLQKIMDQSEGVIYFSMGSVLKGDSLHDKKQQAFIKVFSELKQTVLWKRESPLSENVKNIVTNGWYPQRDILAHPKIQLFITHCGLLGTNEAVSSGVPMVGIPMFGDQHHNAKALESIGVAVTLDFNELNENNIREAINKVLKNPSYKENAKKMKEAYLDRPMSPLDTAVYWVEYVIRHKGAPHLKSAARHLTWYQYHNLDVYALLLLIVYVSYLTVKFIIKFLCALCCKKTKVKTQ